MSACEKPGSHWSIYQQAIFDAVCDSSADAPHLAVRARAGSGKTTTGVHALTLTAQSDRVVALAFNADIARTLSERVPEHADARTFHSAGFGAVRSAYSSAVKVNKDLTWQRATSLCPDDPASYKAALVRVVSLAKSTLADRSPIAMGKLATAYHLDGAPEPWTPARDRFNQEALTLYLRAEKPQGEIDFDDMCWLPVRHNLPMRPWDFVMADEAQDLNACQHELVKRLVGKRGRLLAIGDDRQAIYQFRGACENSFDDLARHFDATVLPLSVCYRCDASIVALARETVPDFEARTNAPDGIVRDCGEAEMLAQVRPGDFILSRSKAPLMGHCLALLADGVPATIVGRDIAAGLVALIKKSKAGSIEQLDRWMSAHCAKAAERLSQQDPAAYEEICDRCACVRAVMASADSIASLIGKIERLFSDSTVGASVRLSTTHKAKGLESDRVFALADTYNKRPGLAESNLFYVCITRAKHELALVWKDGGDSNGERHDNA